MRGACGASAGTGETQSVIPRRSWESRGQPYIAVSVALCGSSHLTVLVVVRPVPPQTPVNPRVYASSWGSDCFSDLLTTPLQTDLHFPASASSRWAVILLLTPLSCNIIASLNPDRTQTDTGVYWVIHWVGKIMLKLLFLFMFSSLRFKIIPF